MKTIEYSICECLAHWVKNKKVYVNSDNKQGDWLHDKEGYSWKPLWIIEEFYQYTTWVATDLKKPDSPTNFCSCWGFGPEQDLAELVGDIWFSEVARLGRSLHKDCHEDNKTAIKLRNRLTNEIVYLGYYDGRITVGNRVKSEHESIHLLDN